jgi:hypothetical protein
MATAEMTLDQETASPADIDSLLSQADSLMAEIASDLPTEASAETPTATATESTSPAESQPVETAAVETANVETPIADAQAPEEIRDIADAITVPTESADADAIVAALNSDRAEPTASPPGENNTKVQAAPPPAPTDGPRNAPADWIEEASQGDAGADMQVPPIPDENSLSNSGDSADGSLTAESRPRGAIGRLVTGVVRLPITILVVLDLPFAGLSMGVKSAIGAAAVATLIVAIATWFAGGMLQPH